MRDSGKPKQASGWLWAQLLRHEHARQPGKLQLSSLLCCLPRRTTNRCLRRGWLCWAGNRHRRSHGRETIARHFAGFVYELRDDLIQRVHEYMVTACVAAWFLDA